MPWPEIPVETPLWWYITAMSLAVLITGIGKSGFGGGIGIVAVPLTANALPAERAIGVMLPILIFADLFAVWSHRRNVSKPHLKWTYLGAIPGVMAGTGLLLYFKLKGEAGAEVALTQMLNITVGGICLVFVAVQAWRLAGGSVPRIPPGPGGGAASGGAAGFVSTLAHSAGPVMSIYLLEQKLEKRLLVGTMVLFFFALNLTKLPTYLGLQIITPRTFFESVLFFPLVPIGAVIGLWMLKRIPEKPFTFVIYAAAALAGARMIWKGLV